jgi:dethiobiotin synthetase
MLNLYVTSANKGDGKTFLTAGIAATMQSLGYATSVYKPIQTSGKELNGFMQSPDLTFVKSIDPYINTHFTYLFKSKAEPLIAAENENEFISLDLIQKDFQSIIETSDCTILDGDCGLLSPIAASCQNVDLIKKIQVPVLFIVSPRDDSINDALLSIYTAQEKGLDIRGVVINNIKEDWPAEVLTATTRVIEEYSNVNILGLLPNLGTKVRPEELISGVLNGIDIESIFNVKIEKLELS